MGNPMTGDGGGFENPKDALKKDILGDIRTYVERHATFQGGAILERVGDHLRASTNFANKGSIVEAERMLQDADAQIDRLNEQDRDTESVGVEAIKEMIRRLATMQ